MDRCAVPGCRRTDIDLFYYDRPVCARHWEAHCNDNRRLNLKQALKIKTKPKPQKTANSLGERLRRIRALRERIAK